MNLHESYGKSAQYEVTPLNHFRLQYFKKNYDHIIAGLPKNGKVLEIGPGGGTFAEYLLQYGFENITLCEYSTVIASKLEEYFKDQPKIKVINENAILHLGNNLNTYDVIVSQQVIEHFAYTDFITLLGKISDALNKNGIVILETNNCANIIYGMYLRYCDHTHLLGFTPRSLGNFLETGSFEVLSIFPIHMTGIKDLAYSLVHGMFLKGERKQLKTFNKSITNTSPNAKIGLAILFILRSFGILLSRIISYMMIYPYDKSLGAINNSVFTPTFGIMAKRIED